MSEVGVFQFRFFCFCLSKEFVGISSGPLSLGSKILAHKIFSVKDSQRRDRFSLTYWRDRRHAQSGLPLSDYHVLFVPNQWTSL